MGELPEFQVAISDFRRFLVEQGHADELVCVFRDGLWFRGPQQVWMRSPPPAENVPLAKKVYDEGRQGGVVGITALAMAKGHVAATVWFPRLPEEEVQGWLRGLKLAILQPLPAGNVIGGLRWRMFKCLKGGGGLTKEV